MQVGSNVGMGNDRDRDPRTGDCRDREAYALDSNRALLDDITRERFGNFKFEPAIFTAVACWTQREQLPSTVYVPLHDVPTERSSSRSGQFQIDNPSGGQSREGSASNRFLGQIGFEAISSRFEGSETNTAHGNAVAFFQFRSKSRRRDANAHRARALS